MGLVQQYKRLEDRIWLFHNILAIGCASGAGTQRRPFVFPYLLCGIYSGGHLRHGRCVVCPSPPTCLSTCKKKRRMAVDGPAGESLKRYSARLMCMRHEHMFRLWVFTSANGGGFSLGFASLTDFPKSHHQLISRMCVLRIVVGESVTYSITLIEELAHSALGIYICWPGSVGEGRAVGNAGDRDQTHCMMDVCQWSRTMMIGDDHTTEKTLRHSRNRDSDK